MRALALVAVSTLRAPWLVVLVCLSDVVDDGGPTVLLRGSQLRQAEKGLWGQGIERLGEKAHKKIVKNEFAIQW